jgi:hypothetical protein
MTSPFSLDLHKQYRISSMRTALLLLFVFFTSCRADFKPPHELFIEITGGEEQFSTQLKIIERYGSELRNGTKCHLETQYYQGCNGMVARATFNDGIQWAVKIQANDDDGYGYESMTRTINAMCAIGRYCPDLPTPRIRGEMGYLANQTLIYHFMDWMKGISLDEDPDYIEISEPESNTELNTTLPVYIQGTLPEKTIVGLAEFVYNLSTCALPQSEGKHFTYLTES